MMQVTVIGCWAPYPAAFGACPSYLVQVDDKKILLDIGHGSFSQLQGIMDFRQLDLVIISHLHPDHYMDIWCLRHAIKGALADGSRLSKLPIYMPNTPTADYQSILKVEDALEIYPINDSMTRLELGQVKITFTQANHPIKTFATAVEWEGKKIFYTGDTGESEKIAQGANNADLLICEASLLEKDKDYGVQTGHLTAQGAAQLANKANAKQLLLTHLWPEYDLNILHQEAEELFANVILAKEGLSINI